MKAEGLRKQAWAAGQCHTTLASASNALGPQFPASCNDRVGLEGLVPPGQIFQNPGNPLELYPGLLRAKVTGDKHLAHADLASSGNCLK